VIYAVKKNKFNLKKIVWTLHGFFSFDPHWADL